MAGCSCVESIVGKKMDHDLPPCKRLPHELWIENILTRLPARTLARCSSVSKLWYNSISKDSRFAAIHNFRNRNNTSLIFNLLNVYKGDTDNAYFFSLDKDTQDNHVDPKFLARLRTPDTCEIVGYCNGLACIKEISLPGDAVGSIAVVNPIRSQTLTLRYVTPTAGYRYLCHGFGFDSLSEVYKAVIVFTSKDNNEFHCMVITLGTSSWRSITTRMADISPPPGCSPFSSRMVTIVSRSFCRQATFCGGDLLWRTTSEVDNDGKIEMLLSFDLHNEKILFIRLPAECTPITAMNERRQYLILDHLLEFKGYPCIARSEKIMRSNGDHSGHRCGYRRNLTCCCCCTVHMYILMDKGKQVWIREETFDVQIKYQESSLPAPLCCYFETSAVTPPTRILTLSDQVLLYWFNGESLILYNLLEKQLKVVKCTSSYPGIFRTKMSETLGRCFGDDSNMDCPYMDYQLYAQVENLVSMETFIPKGAKTNKYDCFEDLQHAIEGNLPAGCVGMGRESLNCYAFWEDKEVGDEVSDNVEGISNSKNLRMGKLALLFLKKKLMDDPTGPLASVQSSGSELSELLSGYHTIFEVRKRHSVSNYRSMAVLEGNLPAGLNTGRSLNCYAFHEVSDNLEGHPNGSCRSKHSRSKKNSGKANRTLTAKTGKKVQSTGSELSEVLSSCRTELSESLSSCRTVIELLRSHAVPNFVPVEQWMAVLEGVPDLDEDLKFDAINFLRCNPLRAITFVVMCPDIRRLWLIAELRGN